MASLRIDAEDGPNWRGKNLLPLFLLLLAIVCVGTFVVEFVFAKNEEVIPQSIISNKVADYGVYALSMQMQPLKFGLIEDVLSHQLSNSQEVAARLEFLRGILKTPVPTVDSSLLVRATNTAITVQSPTVEETAQQTPATSTAKAEASSTSTDRIQPSRTNTAKAQTSSTVAASSTPKPASSTPKPPSSTPKTPSSTPKPPSSTPVPPSASPIPPTSTSIPASPTSGVVVCQDISLSSVALDGQKATRTISNGASSAIRLTDLRLVWPGGNNDLVKVELFGDAIWDDSDPSSPTIISESGWKSGVNRTIGPGQNAELLFQFNTSAGNGGYQTTLTFDNGCEVNKNN